MNLPTHFQIVYCVWLAFELVYCCFFIVETNGLSLEETAVLFDGVTEGDISAQAADIGRAESRSFVRVSAVFAAEKQDSEVDCESLTHTAVNASQASFAQSSSTEMETVESTKSKA